MRKNIKAMILLILVFLISISLFGCGRKTHDKGKTPGEQTEQKKPEEVDTESELGSMTDEKIEELFDLREFADGYLIVKYKGERKTITIPKKYKRKEITAIADAFKDNKKIEQVNIPKTIQSLEEEAFFGCTKLRTVNMEEGLLQIYNWAFSKTALEEITIPNSVEHIGGGAFGDAKVKVKEGNMKFEVREECVIDITDEENKTIVSGCKRSTIPRDVKCIGEMAFSRTGLENITIHADVNMIGSGAFGDAQINVEEGNLTYEAKENCLIDKSEKKIISGGKNSKISEDVEIIGENSFSYSEIEAINIPNNIQEINNFAFGCCEKLKNVEIGNGVKIISEGAFFESGIDSIIIPSNVEEVGKGAFQCCKNLTNVTIEEGLKKIETKAFMQTKLESIDIPSTVVKIGGGAFVDINVRISSKNTNYEVKGDCVIEKATLTVVSGRNTSIIPNNVLVIGKNAFEGSKIESIVIPSSVNKIESFAFNECKSLKIVELKEGLRQVFWYAFSRCKLENIVIPSGVDFIDQRVFSGNEKLQKIYCRDIEKPIEWHNEWNSDYVGVEKKYDVVWNYAG